MNREQALKAMSQGKQVEHPHWPGKVLHLVDGHIRVVGTGYGLHYEFVNNPAVAEGWSIKT